MFIIRRRPRSRNLPQNLTTTSWTTANESRQPRRSPNKLSAPSSMTDANLSDFIKTLDSLEVNHKVRIKYNNNYYFIFIMLYI